MKKNDLLLICLILAAAAGGLLFYRFQAQKEAGQVVITVDGKEYKRLELDEDQDLVITGAGGETNHLIIRNKTADMIQASCPDKVCVHQASISKNGETIVCLPNRVVVSITGTEKASLDGVAN